MKRRLDGSALPRIDSSLPWKASLFSTSLRTQLELMDYLGLQKKVKPIQLKKCRVVIQGVKCKVCKRSLKCKTDLENHLNKKHKYLIRKKDNKLVRIKLKMGNETFLDDEINRKYLIPPDHESEETEKSHKIDKSQRPLEICPIQVHKEIPADISKDFIQKGSVSLSAVMEDLKSMEELCCKFNMDKTSNSSPIKQREDCSDRASPALSGTSIETVIYISDIDDVDFDNLYEDVKPKIKEEEDSDDGEIKILHDICRHDFHSIQKRIEQSRSAEAVVDTGFVKSVESVRRLEPMVSYPMEKQQMESQQMVSTAQLPNKQELIEIVDLEAMDYENADFSDISDAETIMFDNDMDEIDLPNADGLELQTEETYSLSIDEQIPAFTSSQADSNIIIVDDEPVNVVEPVNLVKPVKMVEPIKAVEPSKELEPTEYVEPTKVIEQLEQDEQIDLMKRLQVMFEFVKKSNIAAYRKDSPDNNNNSGIFTSNVNVPLKEEALKCLLGVMEQAYQMFSALYNPKLKNSN